LSNPLFIAGLTGFGAVGLISANQLIQTSEAKLFAELHSPYLPDYVIVNNAGIIRLPKYSFYYSKTLDRDIIILTGDAQPSAEYLKAHYQMCSMALDLAIENGCQLVITMGGFPNPNPKKKIYLAATDASLIDKFRDDEAETYVRGRIIGATGLLLGLSKIKGMDGLCVLGVTKGLAADYEAGKAVFDFVMRLIKRIKI